MAGSRDIPWHEWDQEQKRLAKQPSAGGIRTPVPVSARQEMLGPTRPNPGISTQIPGGSQSKYRDERIVQPDPWIEDVDTSTNFYSPMQPIWPFGPPFINRPAQFDYLVGYNLNYVQPRLELMKMLRGLRDSWGVLSTVIATRQDQLLRIPWTIQRRDKPRASSPTVDHIRKFFRRPDGQRSYSQWTRLITDDLLVLDAPCIFFSRDRKGRPLTAERIDPVTIFPLIDDAGRRPESIVEVDEDGLTYLRRQPAFQQIRKGLPMIDLDESEIMYVPMRPRADLPVFGYPATEQIFIEASEAVRKTIYQLQFWSEGSIPDLIITTPDTWCYSEDTEVLTRLGWKRFTEVDINRDEFATRNMTTKEFEWQKATGINLSDYSGDMVWLRSRSVDCLVNPPHRVLISYKGFREDREELIPASELLHKYNGQYRIPVTSTWTGVPIQEKNFKQETNRGGGFDLIISGDDFCSFMGMWLSEGWVGDRDISIAQRKSSKGHEEFAKIMSSVFGDYFSFTNGTFRAYNAPLARYLAQSGRASEKIVPQEIMDATESQIILFLRAFILGDGSISQKGQVTIYTSSKILAGQLQELVQKIGMSAVVGVDDRRGRVVEIENGREVFTQNISYRVGISNSDARKFNMGLEKYSGKIGCVSVPNGTLYVRRNGKACWSGNTPRQIAMFQGHFDAMLSGNLVLKSKVRFIPGGMKPFDIKNSSGESLWSQRDETLIRLCCYAYSVSPAPFIRMLNRSVAQNAQQTAEEEGLFPLMSFWKDDIIDPIIQERFGFGDIEFVFQPRPEPDAEKQSKIHDMKIKNAEYSINEAREENGMEPIVDGDAHLIYIGNAVIPLESAVRGKALPQKGGESSDPASPERPRSPRSPGSKPPPASGQPQRGVARPNSDTPPPKSTPVQKLSQSGVRDAAAGATEDLATLSPGQIAAGNYPKGHFWFYGLNISIENNEGSKRGEKTESGKAKWVEMPAPYGYIRGTIGADNAQVDVYIGKHPESTAVWVIDQNRVSKKGKIKGFDEHKVMLGYRTLKRALRDYLASHFDGLGHERLGDVVELTIPEFKTWLRDGNTRKPIADQAGRLVKSDTISSAIGLSWYDQGPRPSKPKKKKKNRSGSGPKWLNLVAVTLLGALLFGPEADAQSALKTTDYSTSIGTSVVQCVPANSSRKTLFIENPVGGSNNICYRVGATPTCGAAGTSVLVPGEADFWPFGNSPVEAINCIASGSASSVTIRTGQ